MVPFSVASRDSSSSVPVRRTVSVVIPQHNRLELTEQAVSSLLRWHPAGVEVVIVDDGSSERGTFGRLRTLSGNVTLIQSNRRQGVTAAWNLGAKVATGAILIFLNNDTVSLGEWIGRLCGPLEYAGCLMTGCGWRTEREWSAGAGRFLPGWCLAIKRSDFLGFGGFDERFRMYFSDTDLQVRIRLDHPNGLMAVDGLSLRHLGHASTAGLVTRKSEWRRDRLLFRRKWRRGE